MFFYQYYYILQILLRFYGLIEIITNKTILTMKNFTFLSLLLLISSFITIAQSDYTNEHNYYSTPKEVKALHATSSDFNTEGNRETLCNDTSFFPRIKAQALYYRKMQPKITGEQEIGMMYRNNSDIKITGVFAYTNNLFNDINVTAKVFSFVNGKPGVELGSKTAVLNTMTDSTYDVAITFDAGIEVEGDFMVTMGFTDTASTDSILYIYDWNSGGNRKGAWIHLADSASTWFGVDEAGLDELYGSSTDPDSIDYSGTDYNFMLFPVFENTVKATIEVDDADLYPGETATFTGTVSTIEPNDSMITLSAYYNLSNFIWYVVEDNMAIDYDDSSSATTYSHQFDTAGTYLVELRATQSDWKWIFTGTMEQCYDAAALTITVDTSNFQQSIHEITSGALSLQRAYPNPASENITIPFFIKEKSSVKLAVYNVTGQLVNSINNAEYQRGTHNFELNVTSLQKGTYFYTVTTNNESLNGNFNISK